MNNPPDDKRHVLDFVCFSTKFDRVDNLEDLEMWISNVTVGFIALRMTLGQYTKLLSERIYICGIWLLTQNLIVLIAMWQLAPSPCCTRNQKEFLKTWQLPMSWRAVEPRCLGACEVCLAPEAHIPVWRCESNNAVWEVCNLVLSVFFKPMVFIIRYLHLFCMFISLPPSLFLPCHTCRTCSVTPV